MISKLKRYEIHIACFSTADKAALEEICQHVLETVCNILDQVICKMKYKQYLISPYDQTLYQRGFKCPRHPEDDHLVINRPKKGGVEAPSHSAKLVWLNFSKGKSTMICLEEERCVDFAERSLSPSFAEQSLIWFRKVSNDITLYWLVPLTNVMHLSDYFCRLQKSVLHHHSRKVCHITR